jgi:hypothetical protein
MMGKTPHAIRGCPLHAEGKRKELTMPKVSKTSAAATMQDIGVGQVWEGVVDGYEISFLDLRESTDMAPLLRGLPDDLCPCPHWGYVTEGRLTFSYKEHAEVFEAGDGFYVPPGHSPSASPGTAFVLISPAEQAAEVNEVIQRNMAAMTSA